MNRAVLIATPVLLCLIAAARTLAAEPVQSDQPVKSSWLVRDHLPQRDFIVQAHRGAGVLAPENTLAAFELGWKLNCIPEADLRTTKDGVIVSFHDSNFARVVVGIDEAMKKKGVKDVTFDELAALNVGEGRRVSRMTDIYALMKDQPQRRLYLDIKNCDLEQLARELTQQQSQGEGWGRKEGGTVQDGA